MINVAIRVTALDKLVEYVASGIGSIAGPMLATWKARRKAEALRIEAHGKSDSLRIIAKAQADAHAALRDVEGTQESVAEIQAGDVRHSLRFQHEKRLSNIRSVADRAAENLSGQEAPNDAPDPDWTARFFESAQDISSEEMQELWARLLSGEILNPKSVSIQTIAVLRNMSKQDAETFTAFSCYEISGIVHEKSYRKLAPPLSDDKVLDLRELGLIHAPKEVFRELILDHDGRLLARHCGHFLLMQGPPGTKLHIPGWIYTRPGNTLAALCRLEPDMHYLGHFARFLSEQDCMLTIAPIHVDAELGEVFRNSQATLIHPA